MNGKDYNGIIEANLRGLASMSISTTTTTCYQVPPLPLQCCLLLFLEALGGN